MQCAADAKRCAHSALARTPHTYFGRSARWVALALSSAIFVVSGVSHAGEAEAAEAFRIGTELYAIRSYAEAARHFETAFREVPRGAAAYNAGVAWELGQEKARAAQAYAAAIETADFAGRERQDAERRLNLLARELATVRVEGPKGARASVAHVSKAALPAKIYLEPGSYEVKAVLADGRESTHRVTNLGRTAFRRLDVTPAHSDALRHGAGTSTSDTPDTTLAPASDKSSDKRWPVTRTIGLVAVGGAVVATGAAIVLGVNALDAKDDFERSGRRDAAAHDRADSLRTWTNVSWAAAGALGVAGAALVVLSFGDGGSGPRKVTVTGGLTRADLRLTF